MMARQAATGLLALCLALGCASPPRPAIVRPLEARSAVCTAPGGAPAEAAARASLAIAERAIDDTLAALANELPETRRQFIDREREPLQRFPRLTFPLLADPEPADRAGGRTSAAWFVPLILDKKQLGEIPADGLTGAFAFWLVPHGGSAEATGWVEVTDCLVREPGSPSQAFVSDSERRPTLVEPDEIVPTIARRERLRAVAFEIPTRTAARDAHLAAGFYDLKALPRLDALRDAALRTPALEQIAVALREGDWASARLAASRLDPASLDTDGAREDLREMAARIAPFAAWHGTSHPTPNFDTDLLELSRRFAQLAERLERVPTDVGARRLGLSRVEEAMGRVLAAPHSIAPVALRDPGREAPRCGGRNCVRIAVGGDFQYHGNIGALRRFLGMLDPDLIGSADGVGPHESIPDVDFVLFAGDLADSAAGSARDQLLLNVLGIVPPESPYGARGGREMVDIRNQLARFQKPFFAVPGNHDGYAGYGGFFNVLIDEFGFAVGEGVGLFNERVGRSVGGAIKDINTLVPTLFGWRLLNRHPRYDGLGEYQSYLGPLNLAFRFRGHSFVGLNSYDLKPRERAAVGGVVLHWGGGLQDASVEWVAGALDRFAPDEGREQFLFMHHDPRAAVPTKSTYAEQHFGYYDAIDTPVSILTLGHFGLGNSPISGLYLPIVSWSATFATRTIEIGWGDSAGNWQQEWMRKPDWGWSAMPDWKPARFFDFSAYNARGLIDAINCNLAARRQPAAACPEARGNLSQILLAHDNVPVESVWADPAARGAVFREPRTQQLWRDPRWANSMAGHAWGLLGFKFRNGSPPEWAQHMRLDQSQGNAAVLRMDDVGDAGNYHGFHVITLYENGERDVEWYALPR